MIYQMHIFPSGVGSRVKEKTSIDVVEWKADTWVPDNIEMQIREIQSGGKNEPKRKDYIALKKWKISWTERFADRQTHVHSSLIHIQVSANHVYERRSAMCLRLASIQWDLESEERGNVCYMPEWNPGAKNPIWELSSAWKLLVIT